MSANHFHSPQPNDSAAISAAGRHRSRLIFTFVLVAGFFAVELIAAITSSSLALLGDAGHMAADVITLGAALLAVQLAPRRDRTGRRTFGSYRAEVFASGLAVLMMLGVSAYIAVEAIGRIGSAPEPTTGTMLVVGVLGLVVNVISLFLLHAGAGESLNIKGAYLEVLADGLGSVGVICAAVLIDLTGNAWWDTVIALAIAVFVAVRAVILGREVLRVLGQCAPAGVEPLQVQAELEKLPGVAEVHDLHIWQLTSGMNVATAHVVTISDDQPTLTSARHLLREQFGIAHVTLQTETAARSECDGVDW